MDSVIMSYITTRYLSKSDMLVAEQEWQKIVQEMAPKFKSAVALRQTVSQVSNKEGAFILANIWEYKDEQAFVKCRPPFQKLTRN